MPKIDLSQVPLQTGTIYPEEYAGPVQGRSSYRLGPVAGLTQFGANITTLEPGAASSLRHWHLNEDEFLVVLSGELTLVDDDGDTPLAPGENSLKSLRLEPTPSRGCRERPVIVASVARRGYRSSAVR